jgi:hypothetical protein
MMRFAAMTRNFEDGNFQLAAVFFSRALEKEREMEDPIPLFNSPATGMRLQIAWIRAEMVDQQDAAWGLGRLGGGEERETRIMM